MTLVLDSQGRPDLDCIGLNRMAYAPSNFLGGKPSWVTEAGTVVYQAPTASAPFAQLTTAATADAAAELIGPQLRMSYHRGLWLTVGGWHADSASANIRLGMGFYGAGVADGGVQWLEDGTDANGPIMSVRRSGGVGTVNIPTRELLVGDSEYKRRRTVTMLLYRLSHEASSVWHCALLDGTLREGTVFADEPIHAGNGRNTAEVYDIGPVFPRVRITARDAVAHYMRVRTIETGFIDW